MNDPNDWLFAAFGLSVLVALVVGVSVLMGSPSDMDPDGG